MDTRRYASAVNIVLGGWLFISAFLWPHSSQQYVNAWLVGLLVVGMAIIAFWAPPVRYVNTILAGWLLVSNWALASVTVGTRWNHGLVALAILITSLVPSRQSGAGRRLPGSGVANPHPV